MDHLSNFRAAYRILEDKVNRALLTQVGDYRQLGIVHDDALSLLSGIEGVSEPCYIEFASFTKN